MKLRRLVLLSVGILLMSAVALGLVTLLPWWTSEVITRVDLRSCWLRMPLILTWAERRTYVIVDS